MAGPLKETDCPCVIRRPVGPEKPRGPRGFGGTEPTRRPARRRRRRRRLRAGGLLQACSSGTGTSPGAGGSTQDIVIGFIHPLTGALADFGRCDNWIVSTIMATPQYQNGFKAGGKTYPVTIRSYDTESSPAPAPAGQSTLGVNDLGNAFIPMWNKINGQLGTDMAVACMFPDDPDGNAFCSAWPAFAGPAGYTLVAPATPPTPPG